MAYVILGLLQLRQMSLYDLSKAFEQGISLFYSASTGSLKRALDQLLASGDVEVVSAETGGRGRKVYGVTTSGAEKFQAWIRGDVAGKSRDAESVMLARLHFLGLVDPADRGAILDSIEAQARGALEALESLKREVDGTAVPPEFADVALFQKATLDFGLSSHRHIVDWIAKLPRS